MTRLRFLIDDVTACLTQRAVLAHFAATLLERAARQGGEGVEVLWASGLGGLHAWPDVPAESSRRLGVRLVALAPLADTVTVFLPGHVIPGPVELPLPTQRRPAQALASDGVRAVADLDLFVVDNASAQAAALRAHLQVHPGYESASRHEAFTAGPLPAWLTGGGLSSARLYTLRPWYSAHAPLLGPWLQAVERARDAGRLTLDMVAQDVQHARVRPSLLEQASALHGNPLPAGGPDLTLDTLFVPPECRLPPDQRALLHSGELQRRALAEVRRKKTGKAGRDRRSRRGHRLAGWVRAMSRLLRQAGRLGWRLGRRGLYVVYAASLRPLVHRIRAPGGAGS